jgi:N-acetylglucosaminyldiphosphoundecaprenol N-acetyl-beta-D-mannosaminyltransferase
VDSRQSNPAIRTCGIRIDCIDLDEAVAQTIAQASALRSNRDEQRGVAVHLCNAWTLAYGLKDPAHADRVDSGDLNLPDGMPLVWLGKRFGLPISNRVYGPDLMSQTLDQGRISGLRHYLYGTTEETLSQLQERLETRFPGAQIVGSEAPPFRPSTRIEEQSLAARIRDTQADVVWIGLGTPQQDELVHRLRPEVPAVLIPVGAAFDFLAGNKSQAPKWMQQRGLEWLFRLCSEPKRLWRRYLIGNLVFVRGAAPDFLRAVRHAPVAPRVMRPWGAAWEVTRNIPRISVPQSQLDPGAGATSWLGQIDLPGSLRAYGATRLAEEFAGKGSASEHVSQTLCCPTEAFSDAALQILVEQCQNSRSGSGALMQDFTRQLKLRQTR